MRAAEPIDSAVRIELNPRILERQGVQPVAGPLNRERTLSR
jgi:hypothetical protein